MVQDFSHQQYHWDSHANIVFLSTFFISFEASETCSFPSSLRWKLLKLSWISCDLRWSRLSMTIHDWEVHRVTMLFFFWGRCSWFAQCDHASNQTDPLLVGDPQDYTDGARAFDVMSKMVGGRVKSHAGSQQFHTTRNSVAQRTEGVSQPGASLWLSCDAMNLFATMFFKKEYKEVH